MDSKQIEEIVNLYKNGLGCVKISKITGVDKHKILKILNEKKMIRGNRCKSLSYYFDGIYYNIDRKCPRCSNTITTKSKNKTIGCRNYYLSINNKNNCKKCSLDLQVGDGNPFYGKKHTLETKLKISKSRKGKALGCENPMSNPEHRKRAIDGITKKWKNGEMEHVRKIMSETGKKNHKQGKIKSVIKSKAEDEIKDIIQKLGFSVVQSFRVDSKICDIYVPKLNLIIEYYGDYWHCNPKKYDKNYFNKKKSKYAWELWEYDKSKVDLIKNHNYNLEIIWESDYHIDKQIIKKIIDNYGEN